MKLISAEFGQSFQPIHMDEIRPAGGVYVPELVSAIAERYSFVVKPTIPVPEGGFKFQTGVLNINGTTAIATNLDIYTDGIIINSTNTETADLLMDDFLSWVITRFGFRERQTVLPRKLFSSVIVDFSVSANGLIRNFQTVADLIAKALEPNGVALDLHLTRIAIGADPTLGQVANQASFTLEPRAAAPIDKLRYFSTAPLSTSQHLALLEQVEALLTSMAKSSE